MKYIYGEHPLPGKEKDLKLITKLSTLRKEHAKPKTSKKERNNKY